MSGPLKFDRVRQSSTTTGTGNFSLSATILSTYRSFVSTVGNGNTCYYTAVNRGANEWESGICTVNSGTPDTLTRVAINVLDGSAGAGVLVNFSAGTKDIVLSNPAKRGITRGIKIDFAKGELVVSDSNGELNTASNFAIGSVTPGAGAGATGTASAVGTDFVGILTVNTFAADTISQTQQDIATINFGLTRNSIPRVMVQPWNDATWALTYGNWRVRTDDTTTALWKLRGFLPSVTTATYQWIYYAFQ